MSELWYWRTNGRVRGPLVTEELEAIVLQNRLGAGDEVRLENSSDWIPAADIRRLFSSSTPAESPAIVAARLLQSAAARRLNSDGGGARHSTGFGAHFLRLLGAAAGDAAGLIGRCAESGWRWLGRTGRRLITVAAAVACLVFCFTKLDLRRSSETMRQQQIKAVWRQIQADEAAKTSSSANRVIEAAIWLESTQIELERELRDHPVSGSGSGADRQQALARRELLYAVRDIRDYSATPTKDATARIDKSLESAMDYLTGTTISRPDVNAAPGSGQRPGTSSRGIAAIVVIDMVLVGLAAAWWFRRRGQSRR